MRAAQALLLLIGTTLPASANDGFNVVIPGRAGVPIIINGLDASYAVVESDWGLAHNVHLQPTVYGGRTVDLGPSVGHYYPSAGHVPGYGRLEIQPPANRKLPPRAESFHQSWSAHSESSPAQTDVPYNPPAVIVAPEIGASTLPHDFPPPASPEIATLESITNQETDRQESVMRQMISGLAAAIAMVTVSAVPAMACGGGLFAGAWSPCGGIPCAESYVPEAYSYAPVTNYSGCNSGCGGWAHERLPELSPQYYHVNQGPTYSGPGNFAPLPTYQESAVSGWNAYSRPLLLRL